MSARYLEVFHVCRVFSAISLLSRRSTGRHLRLEMSYRGGMGRRRGGGPNRGGGGGRRGRGGGGGPPPGLSGREIGMWYASRSRGKKRERERKEVRDMVDSLYLASHTLHGEKKSPVGDTRA